MVNSKIKQYTLSIHFAIKKKCEKFVKNMINNENIFLLLKNQNIRLINSYDNWYKRKNTSYLILYLVVEIDINRIALQDLGCWYGFLRNLINYKNSVRKRLLKNTKRYVKYRIYHWRKIIKLVKLKCYYNDIIYIENTKS